MRQKFWMRMWMVSLTAERFRLVNGMIPERLNKIWAAWNYGGDVAKMAATAGIHWRIGSRLGSSFSIFNSEASAQKSELGCHHHPIRWGNESIFHPADLAAANFFSGYSTSARQLGPVWWSASPYTPPNLTSAFRIRHCLSIFNLNILARNYGLLHPKTGGKFFRSDCALALS